MKIIFAAIKSALFGGCIIGVSYGTYKFVESIKDDSGTNGINVFDYLKTTGTNSSINLDMVINGAQLLNQKELVDNLAKNMDLIKKISKDDKKMEIVTKLIKGCSETKNANTSSCKDLTPTLKLIADGISATTKAGESSSTSGIAAVTKNLPFIKISDTDVINAFQNAPADQLMDYLQTNQKIENAKTTIQGLLPQEASATIGKAMDTMSSLYSYWKLYPFTKSSTAVHKTN